jgi:hypothetical protein
MLIIDTENLGPLGELSTGTISVFLFISELFCPICFSLKKYEVLYQSITEELVWGYTRTEVFLWKSWSQLQTKNVGKNTGNCVIGL